MLRPHSLRACLVLGTALLVLGGCSSTASLTPTTAANAEVAANFQALSDIPIPSGATLDPEKSIILGNLDRWTGRVVMKMPMPTLQTAGLFQQQMPGFGWQSVMSAQAEQAVLTYLRGDRAATVVIMPSMLGGSNVSITVAPRQVDATTSGSIQSETLPPPGAARRR